ncbi:unnamed protein product [Rhizophagus irregularis]|uniref:Uncharacterized protein n=1 Tax=Rhizophagus irregularis TaxID=588596 RepID=A0A915ZUK0_9GLOM|nr:unnamed protein product [Rhizophagus irregularis]CAB5387757.1 unnamed protein product [Rhizophagus irregularis]
MTEVNKVYGMTQNPETNDYMIVLSDKFTLEFMNEVASHNKVDKAIYESRLLNFYNLPEPKNSDDYYEQNDDIISKKFSDSLQINFSQLNINKDDSLQMDIDN